MVLDVIGVGHAALKKFLLFFPSFALSAKLGSERSRWKKDNGLKVGGEEGNA